LAVAKTIGIGIVLHTVETDCRVAVIAVIVYVPVSVVVESTSPRIEKSTVGVEFLIKTRCYDAITLVAELFSTRFVPDGAA
jgi:hypothetical protein